MVKETKNENQTTFSEALEKAGFGLFNYIVILIGSLVLFNAFVETTSIGYYMPVAHCDLELTDSRKGLLSSVPFIGIILSSHLWGFLADTKGRARIMWPTLIAGFVITLISSFSINYWMMLILRFLNGVCVCGSSSTIYAYVGEFHIDRTRSRAIMFVGFILAFICLFYPTMTIAIINADWVFYVPFLDIYYKPWRLYVIIMGSFGLLAGVVLYFLPESPKYLLSMKRENEATEVMKKINKINCRGQEIKITKLILAEECDDILPMAANKNLNLCFSIFQTMWHQTAPLFNRKYMKTTLIICLAQFWLNFISNGLYLWFPYIENAIVEFMNKHPGENRLLCDIVYDNLDGLYANKTTTECTSKLEDDMYFYSLLMQFGYAGAFVVLTIVINYIENILLLFIMIVGFSCCGLVAVWLPNTSIAAIFYVFLFVIGATVYVLGAITVDIYPTQLRALSMGVAATVGAIGTVAGTSVVGAVLSLNCEATFYVTCIIMIGCAFSLLLLPRKISDVTSTSAQELSL